jgi:transposase
MTVYGGIDLHANNSVLALIDDNGKVVSNKRYPNKLERIFAALEPFSSDIDSLVIESTFNWYWIVDGLMDHGFDVRLCNPAKADRYDGLKYSDDFSDARWLAEMRRLGILPEGYIYPRAERAVRDLLRRRAHLVRQRTSLLLSTQNLMQRNTGAHLNANEIKRLRREHGEHGLSDPNLALAVEANADLVDAFNEQISAIERRVKSEMQQRPDFHALKSVAGIGDVLAWTILLETGDINRFGNPGQYASYCRCVKSERRSNNFALGRRRAPRRQPLPMLGVHRGRALRTALLSPGAAVLRTKICARQRPQSDQGGRAQARPRELPRHARWCRLRYRARLLSNDGAVSQRWGWSNHQT